MKYFFTVSVSFIFLLLSHRCLAAPKCEIKNNTSRQDLGIVSGLASGFGSGKIYITLKNGPRKYTTVAEKTGHWSLSFAELENRSEILCWQEGNALTAGYSISKK